MYTQSITRSHRTAFVLAIDCSGSMSESIAFHNRRMTKAEAVASVANQLLFELTERARRNDGIRNYYDIAVVGYSGDQGHMLLGDQETFYPITKIADMAGQARNSTEEYRLPNGETAMFNQVPIPEWITPLAQGETPMYDTLLRVRDMVSRWTLQPENRDSFPPIVFNITDGEASDCDDDELREICAQIRTLSTNDGNVLLINIHIASGTEGQPLIFPSTHQASYGSRYASVLYDCSSEMPEIFNAAIGEMRGGTPPYRGMSYNASASELVSVLNIGSISLKTE